ncbi:MAG TPA: hypothetical protein DEH78_14910 [Solibacterales bacterium]|nr:hypothetical protein [Bryobacterales bacterium]
MSVRSSFEAHTRFSSRHTKIEYQVLSVAPGPALNRRTHLFLVEVVERLGPSNGEQCYGMESTLTEFLPVNAEFFRHWSFVAETRRKTRRFGRKAS